MKRKRYALPAASLALAVLLTACGGSPAETVRPVLGDIADTVEESGTVYYSEHYTITSTVGGRITGCGFDAGDQVEQGQTLYTIDDTDLADQIADARISLETVRAAYSQAVQAAADLTVKSYLSGMVTEVYCHTGDYITAGSKVARVVDSTRLKLRLAYADAGTIRVGSAAKISVSGEASPIDGTVTRIDEQSTVFPGRQTGVYAEISFRNPGALNTGEAATATVGGIAPIAAGAIEYGTDGAVYSAGTGLVTAVTASEGSAVSPGSAVLTIKNDAVANAVTNAALGVSGAEETLAQLEAALDHYTIKAPVSGIILERTAKVSDIAAAAVPLATLSAGETIHVEVDVDEQYIAKVSLGQTAAVTPTSGEDSAVYSGVVKEISDSGTVANGVTYYTVKLSLDRQDGLMDGMNVDVSILVNSKKNCLLVPKSCLVNGNQVEVRENGKTVVKDVTVGITDGKNAEILSGLSEADEVIRQ